MGVFSLGRLCCPLVADGSAVPPPVGIAPFFGLRAPNLGEVIDRGSLPSDPKPPKLATPSPKEGAPMGGGGEGFTYKWIF